ILDVVRTAYALRPEGINWPHHPDGRPSFRLEQLTAENGIAHEAAHDALSDVRATIALARLIRDRQPKLFDYCFSLHKKDRVAAEIGLPLRRPFLHITGMFPAERGCIGIVWPLAAHPTNKNEIIVWDLAADPSEIATLDAETIRTRLFTKTEALPEGMSRLPIKSIHLNKSPIVINNLKTLGADTTEKWNIDVATALRHADIAAATPDMSAIWQEVFHRPQEAPPDVAEGLYGGSVGNGGRRLLQDLSALPAAALARATPSFSDARLEALFC